MFKAMMLTKTGDETELEEQCQKTKKKNYNHFNYSKQSQLPSQVLSTKQLLSVRTLIQCKSSERHSKDLNTESVPNETKSIKLTITIISIHNIQFINLLQLYTIRHCDYSYNYNWLFINHTINIYTSKSNYNLHIIFIIFYFTSNLRFQITSYFST